MDRNLKKKCESGKEQFSVNRAKKQGEEHGIPRFSSCEKRGKRQCSFKIYVEMLD